MLVALRNYWQVLETAPTDKAQKFSDILAGIWRSWNKKLWNNIIVSASSTVYRALKELFSWNVAQSLKKSLVQCVNPFVECLKWHLPLPVY